MQFTGVALVLSAPLLGAGSSLPPTASFNEYLRHFERSYSANTSEYTERLALFQQRAQAARVQNARPGATWTAVLNKFADRTDGELKALRGWRPSRRAGAPRLGFVQAAKTGWSARNDLALPTHKDWSHLHSLQSVMDQGGCGSCWAVAAATMLRAHYEIATGSVKAFSPQQLVNCVPNPKDCGGTGGCSGATVELAMEYVHGIGLANFGDVDQVPYTGNDGSCQKDSLMALSANLRGVRQHYQIDSGAKLVGYHTLPKNELRPLLSALLEGPVAVSVAASNWYSYENGVFDSCDGDWIIDHAVLAIGFGEEDGMQFFTIRNSWGKDWGEGGNIRIQRQSVEEVQRCGEDTKPADGVECKPYPDKVTVCGTCGVLYDSVAPSLRSERDTTSVDDNAEREDQ